MKRMQITPIEREEREREKRWSKWLPAVSQWLPHKQEEEERRVGLKNKKKKLASKQATQKHASPFSPLPLLCKFPAAERAEREQNGVVGCGRQLVL